MPPLRAQRNEVILLSMQLLVLLLVLLLCQVMLMLVLLLVLLCRGGMAICHTVPQFSRFARSSYHLTRRFKVLVKRATEP